MGKPEETSVISLASGSAAAKAFVSEVSSGDLQEQTCSGKSIDTEAAAAIATPSERKEQQVGEREGDELSTQHMLQSHTLQPTASSRDR